MDGKKYDNPNSASAGNYGYSNQQKINNNYPGGYSSSSYGYTGANAHKGSSSTKYIMGAAVAGVVVGGGAMYLGSRWSQNGWGWRNRNCDSGGYSSQNRGRNCQMNRNANRDDMMGTGFIPADFISPISLTIYRVDGSDFIDTTTGVPPVGVCPPNGWDAEKNEPAWTPVDPFPDIYLTLTPMMELEETLGSDTTHYANAAKASFQEMSPFLLLVLLAFNVRRLL